MHSTPRGSRLPDRARRRRCVALVAIAMGAMAMGPLPGCVTDGPLWRSEASPNAQVASPAESAPFAGGPSPAAHGNGQRKEILPAKHDDAVVTTAVQTSDPSGSAGSSTPTAAALGTMTPSIPLSLAVYPIDLSTSLRLAEVENPRIAEARTGILEALAAQQGARSLLLPTLNAGVSYHGHTGNLQRSSGRILSLSEQSLYVGGGARTLAAESVNIPMVNIFSPLTDAIFEPLAARQRLDGARFSASATANDVLLEVALLHQELLYAEADLGMRRLTEAQAAEVARLTAAYAQTQMGLQSDANRAATELKHRQLDVERGEEAVAVASARLARRLHLDPAVQLRTLEQQFEPMAIVDLESAVEDLIRVALQQRPDVGARSAAVSVARTRYGQERARPLLPTLWMGFSGGMFGGGSNLVPPLVGNFAGRTDFDVRAIWTLQNLGIGNWALQRERQAEIGQAVGEQSRMISQVRREVAAAYAQAL
ncbi:MAG TPA: hypothetical protein VGZ22_29370, partial [Isosphaeraceae bacterium]|nr:hypothetical protein [Isosphaeraceae bacterium]